MIKKKILIYIVLTFFITFGPAAAQESKSIPEARKANLTELLNYRFRGGYYSFEKLFQQTVKYPPIAKANCIMGIAIMSFRVSCNGVVYNIRNKNPMGYGIDSEIASFLSKTKGMWNDCHDEKYTKFEVPIQFKLSGTETNTTDALLVLEEENPGYLCNDDEYYINKMNKYLDKGNQKKALKYIKIMLIRDPYNSHYQDLLKKATGEK